MNAEYTLPQLRRLLALAEELGFAEDVAHWKSEIRKAEENAS